MVTKPLHFKQVAELMNVKIDYLRDLNPQYRRDVIPAGKKAYALTLGFNHVTDFVAIEDSVYKYERNKYFPEGKLVVGPSKTYYPPVVPKGHAKVYYTVKSGDAVGLIAQWFHVRTSDLRYWNNIHRNIIRVGQKLVIYVPKNKVSKYKKLNTMSFAQKQASIGKSVSKPKTQTVRKEPEDDSYIYYTVRRGDNLWSIAKKFSGVTNESLMKLNNIDDVRKISPGQRLKIKKKS
jgi:membrane-bound lytic murein transglycosylase D